MGDIDITLNCKGCGKDFVFSASEQRFFASKGLTHKPNHCKDCRKKRREGKEVKR